MMIRKNIIFFSCYYFAFLKIKFFAIITNNKIFIYIMKNDTNEIILKRFKKHNIKYLFF